ncbi:hypothetical protein DXG01_016928 [Tephrocybe rancida]|nr:hypothetical protein DXG01_016928 [Tephrocybe rancida]
MSSTLFLTITMPIELAADLVTTLHARYGKDKIRVLRVVRDGSWHHVVEYNVTALLEGDIDVSRTALVKNITYYLAKVSPHILIPEHFALHLGTHLVSRYAHINKAFITIEQLRWSRISVNNSQAPDGAEQGHSHAFLRDGEDKRIVKVEIDASAGKDKLLGRVSAGISDLLGESFPSPLSMHRLSQHTLHPTVLKSTGSSFSSFLRDEYTTLAEVDDRIFSTAIDLHYDFAPVNLTSPQDVKKLDFVLGEIVKGSVWDAPGVATRARDVTLEVFAEDDSASVQATLYKMAQLVLSQNAGIQSVTYALPNKHYIPVDMRYIGVENVSPPSNAEVFMPIAAPSGLITATVSRK